MACQALAEPFAASISLGDTSQPQTAFHLRRSRARKNPLRPSPKKLSTSPRDTLSHSKFGLTIKFEALGTHQSTSELSTMPSSTSSIDSGMRYTKTGRVSKAQKGLRGAHTCVCGKVSLFNLVHQFPLFIHLFGVLHCLYPVPLQPTLRLYVREHWHLYYTISNPRTFRYQYIHSFANVK